MTELFCSQEVKTISFRLTSESCVKQQPGGLPDFVVGPENHLVATIVEDVASVDTTDDLDGTWLNPLCLFGPPGVGKSHLAVGIIQRLRAKFAGQNEIRTTTAADFANQYSAAVSEDRLTGFRERFDDASIWLIEDVGRLPASGRVQDEFCNRLSATLAAGCWVITTSRQSPQQLTQLTPAIRSRLTSGCSVPITPPGLHAREVMLRQMAREKNIDLSDREVHDMAVRLPATARHLQGAINKLSTNQIAAQHNGSAKASTTDETYNAIALQDVVSMTARYYGLSQSLLRGSTRKKSVVHARSVAMYLGRELANGTLQRIGAVLGGRDHTTVLHACRKIDEMLVNQPSVREEVDDLRRLLLAH